MTEAERNFSDLISRVVERGETAVLIRNGSVVARIVPEPVKKALTGKEFAEMWAKRPRLTPGEADQLADDVEAARREWNPTKRSVGKMGRIPSRFRTPPRLH